MILTFNQQVLVQDKENFPESITIKMKMEFEKWIPVIEPVRDNFHATLSYFLDTLKIPLFSLIQEVVSLDLLHTAKRNCSLNYFNGARFP